VREAFALWWSNPITALLFVLLTFVLLLGSVVALVAVVRLGGIQLGAMLAERSRLLPRYPRRGDAFGTLVLFLFLGAGGLLVLFSLAVVRTGMLAGTSIGILLLLILAGWMLTLGGPLLVLHGPHVEPVALAVLALLRPFAPVLRALSRHDDEESGVEEDEEVDEHDLQAFIGAGQEAGILAPEEGKLIASVLEMGGTVAREIMTPRTDVVALPLSASFDGVQQRFAESMFTRLPVFRESLDRIEGVVHVKDVLRAVAAGSRPVCGELVRPVLIVPETKPLRELLREFQNTRQQLAVVVDEYGGTSGIVTLEDVLEEIVGEIQDEHQREMPEVEEEHEGVYLVAGGAHVEVLEELFGVEVDEEGFDSVAGLVLERLGHLPRPGEKVRWQNLRLEVVEVDRRRLRRVRVRREEDGP
jgi:CBS domain containing-hemolysin-like protein